jgi:hypothetical protein
MNELVTTQNSNFDMSEFTSTRILDELFKIHLPTSIIDFSCCSGQRLVHSKNFGIFDVLGLAPTEFDEDKLLIDPRRTRAVNFDQPLHIGRRFDLAIALNTLSNISRIRISSFIEELISTSDLILFSDAGAANEEGLAHHYWPEHWAQTFWDQGYSCYDICSTLETGFSNTFLYAKRGHDISNKLEKLNVDGEPLTWMYPNEHINFFASLVNDKSVRLKAEVNDWRKYAQSYAKKVYNAKIIDQNKYVSALKAELLRLNADFELYKQIHSGNENSELDLHLKIRSLEDKLKSLRLAFDASLKYVEETAKLEYSGGYKIGKREAIVTETPQELAPSQAHWPNKIVVRLRRLYFASRMRCRRILMRLMPSRDALAKAEAIQTLKARVLDTGIFDSKWYLGTYKDIAEVGIDPLEHFVNKGVNEGRKPNANFDLKMFLKHHPEVEGAIIVPIELVLLAASKKGLWHGNTGE